MAAPKLKTSTNSKEYISVIWDKIDMQYIDVARVAFAVSLINSGWVVDNNESLEDTLWQEYNEYSWKDPEFYRALLCCVYQKNLSDEEFFSSQSHLKYHIDRWAKILWDIWENKAKWDKNVFLMEIASFVK